MALTKDEELRISSEVFEALLYGNEARVIEICSIIPKGPMHVVTIHDESVLSMVTYLKKNDLALELLDMVPMCDSHKLTFQNNGGYTILHETALNNRTCEVAAELLRRAPMLLGMTNRLGETALFSAAVHGKIKIFKLLHDEVCRTTQGQELKTFLQRDDRSTILHKAILCRNYKMAYEIAVKHEYLIHEKDGDEMTPLQLLSCSPPVFGPNSFFMRMIYKLIDLDTSRMLSWLEKKRREKHSCEWAMKLVKLLVKADTSWEMTETWIKKGRSTVHLYGRSKSTIEYEQTIADVRKPDTPLLLATINGCTKIVEEILKVYPQAMDHYDQDGHNILSLAILHRRIEIIDLVDSMEILKQRVRGNIDNSGNTLLHLVGEKVHDMAEETKTPALVLQEDALLFKRVEETCTTFDTMRLNSKGKTAQKVFFENNNKLRSDAKEWMSENAKNCSIVAVLIATVAFAAAYTVPGGPDSKTGYPVLKNKPLFLIFTIADAISLSSSLTSVIIFLNILTSSYHFKDFEKSLFQKLHIGLTLLIISVAMMMVAFAATLILTISSGRKWTDITLYTVSFFPVLIFMFTYVRFYKQLIGAVFRAFKQTLLHYHNPKPKVWHYKRHSRHQTTSSRFPV